MHKISYSKKRYLYLPKLSFFQIYPQYGDDCTIAIYNSGGIKDSLQTGEITMREIGKVLPYNNKINTIRITGKTLKDVFNHSAESLSKGGFLQV